MEWLNLTCSFGPMNNYLNCYCYSGYYWNSLSGSCTIMGQINGSSCLGTYYNYACNSNASLTCSSSSAGTCQCIFIYLKHHLKYTYDLIGFKLKAEQIIFFTQEQELVQLSVDIKVIVKTIIGAMEQQLVLV